MASINKITEVIAAIKTIYPYYAKETDVQMLVKTWDVLLKDYPDDEVTTALYMCLKTCKMPPTPADLIERLASVRSSLEPSDEELWNDFIKALKKANGLVYMFRFNYVEPNGRTQGENARSKFERLYESLPERIKMYLGGSGEFLLLARSYDEEELKFEKTRFLKTMPSIKKRHEYQQMNLTLEGGASFGQLTDGGR